MCWRKNSEKWMEPVALLVSQTTVGVARIDGTRYEVLDVGGASLSDLVKSGAMDRLERARVISTLEKEAVTLRAPIASPGKVIIVGLNYRDHAAEIGAELPRVPRVYLTAASAMIEPTDDIPLPRIAESAVDFEGEMAVVIGTPASDVSRDKAWSHVAGLTIANDITARDVQNGSNPRVSGPNVGLAKGFDGFKPLGPALLTAESAREGQALVLRTLVDGEIRQESSTAEMHFSVAELVSHISQYTTLHRGDVILTGTPGGVGASSGRFLRAGQVVEVELEGVGVLRNRVAAPSPGQGSSL
jgi:2-keto-4-pentenoate hydratase/2-oxohepta-3-ene-1,7-dioic acid hydratase in catechol pathway